MNIKVRYNVFETNSSSMHSIVLSKNKEMFTEEEVKHSFSYFSRFKKDSVVYFDIDDIYSNHHCLEFTRAPFDILYTYCDKLRYVIGCHNIDEAYIERLLEKVKEKHPFIKDFKFSTKKRYYDDEDEPDEIYYGYTDDGPGMVDSFLAKHLIDIEEFLLRKDIIIIVDGDEYGASLHMQRANILALADDGAVEECSYVD